MLVKIGAKVVRHGRYVTFQLGEVAVSRQMFRQILWLIALAARATGARLTQAVVSAGSELWEACALMTGTQPSAARRGQV